MNSFTEDFLDYDEIHADINKLTDTDFSLTSPPNSDSTGLYINPLSPSYPNFFPLNDQYGVDPSAHEIEYDHNAYQTSQRGGAQITRGIYDQEEDEKLLSKSKRIMKRNAAKERKKAKEEIIFSLEGVDKKFIPEGFDDPNLDDKTRKKMIQMIRNRISAQSSRDRKKFQMQKLEDINTQIMEENSNLLREKSSLLQEISRLQESERNLFKELETLRQSNICSSCGRSSNGDFTHNMDENQDEEGLHIGGLSNLSSPLLNRFASGGKGFLTFFAFATLLSLIVVMNYQPNGGIVMGGLNDMKDTRLLEVDNGFCQNPNGKVETVEVNELEFALANSVIIKNIQSLIENFDMNHELAFKSQVQRLETLDTIPKKEEYIDLNEPESQNGIIGSNYFLGSNLRRPAIQAINTKNLPVISQNAPAKAHTARLFCPSAFEFGNKEEKAVIEGNELETWALDLEKSEYLQLFVPKGSIAKYNTNLTLNDLYGLPLEINNESENTILEIWLKVFMVRELSTTF